MQRLGASEHRAERLQRGPDHVVEGLLRGQRRATSLRVKSQPRRRIAGVEFFPHEPRPQPPRRAELGYFLKKIAIARKEEGKPRPELVDGEPDGLRATDVLQSVGKGERDLLRGRRTRFAHVIARNRNGIDAHLGG